MDENVISSAPVVVEAAPVSQAPEVGAAPTGAGVVSSQPTAPVVADAPMTFLGGDAVITPDSQVEGPAPGEVIQSAEPAPMLPPVFEFVLPEGLTSESERLTEFSAMLGNVTVETKAEAEVMKKFGQQMVDMHIAEMRNAIQMTNQMAEQRYAHTQNELRQQWKDSFLNDPEIGGNRQDTALNSARLAVRSYVTSSTDPVVAQRHMTEFKDLMNTTGIGDHPVMIRLLNNVWAAQREGTPLPAPQVAPQNKSRVTAMYGS